MTRAGRLLIKFTSASFRFDYMSSLKHYARAPLLLLFGRTFIQVTFWICAIQILTKSFQHLAGVLQEKLERCFVVLLKLPCNAAPIPLKLIYPVFKIMLPVSSSNWKKLSAETNFLGVENALISLDFSTNSIWLCPFYKSTVEDHFSLATDCN